MIVYRIEIPYSDHEQNHQDIQLHMPGIICSVCQATWGGYTRHYANITDHELCTQLTGWPLPEIEWKKLERSLKLNCKSLEHVDIEPGMIFGYPRFVIHESDMKDFIEIFPGQTLISSRVKDALEQEQITGYKTVSIELFLFDDEGRQQQAKQAYYEIIVTGHALRIGSTLESIITCNHCKRSIFPDPDYLQVDTNRYDGSDFFHLDMNPNIVFASEKLATLISRFDTGICRQIPQRSETLRLLR